MALACALCTVSVLGPRRGPRSVSGLVLTDPPVGGQSQPGVPAASSWLQRRWILHMGLCRAAEGQPAWGPAGQIWEELRCFSLFSFGSHTG